MVGKYVAALSACTALAGIGSAVYAQTPRDDTKHAIPQVSGTGDAPDAIVVTARRVAEDLQRVPLSIAALGAQALEKSNVTTLGDLTRVVPAIRFQGSGSFLVTEVTIRGIGKAPVGTGGQGVEIYFADVPIVGSPLPTYDLQSIQVLKGPQGTLFGRNTIGGAILINPVPPSFDPSGYAKVSYGNYNDRIAEGAANIPLIHDLAALRVAGQIHRRDPYTKNFGVGPDFDDIHTESGRASLLLTPGGGIRNTTVFDFFHARENGPATIAFGYNPVSLYPCPQICVNAIEQALAAGPNKTYSDVSNPYPFAKRRFYGVVNTTEIKIMGDIRIKNIFGYRNSNQLYRIDNDGTDLPLLTISVTDHTATITNELQFLGSVFNDRLNFIIGEFYYRQKPAGAVGNPASAPLPQSAAYISSTSYATFANVDFGLTDRLKLSAGFRYTWDKQSTCSSVNLVTTAFDQIPSYAECKAFAANPANIIANGQGIIGQKNSAPTWSIGVNYQATDDVMVYVVSRRGYRSGGFNTPIFDTPCTTGSPACDNILTPAPHDGAAIDLRPFQKIGNEYLTDVEVGVRSQLRLGGWRQRINISGFRYVYSNLLSSLAVNCQYLDPGCPAFPIVGFNSGSVTAKGVEFDILLQPSRSFSLGLNGSYIDARQTKPGTPPPDAVPPGFGGIPPANLGAPKFAGTASVTYMLPIRPLEGEMRLNADIFHTASFEVQNTKLPGYNLVNGRFDWSNISNSGLTLSLWARNIFDRRYINSPSAVGAYTPGGAPALVPFRTGNYGERRMFGVEATYRWGK